MTIPPRLIMGYAHIARHVEHAFRTGEGLAYDHQDADVLTGVERFYLPVTGAGSAASDPRSRRRSTS